MQFARPVVIGTAAAAACYLAWRWSKPTPVLCAKASYKDPAKVGDCPFTHLVRVAFHLSGRSYTSVPITRNPDGTMEHPPSWLLDIKGGGPGCMPCYAPNGIANGTGAVVESMVIAKAALPPTPADEAALGAEDGLFPAIAKLIKNKDAAGTGADMELRTALRAALGKLEGHLAETGSPFFGGAAPGLSDTSISSKLYVISAAATHYKSFALDNTTPLLMAYQDRMFAHPAFEKAKYDPDDAITGWGVAREA